MKSWGSAAAVVAAVRDDAAAECERLERETAAALEALARAAAVPAGEGGGRAAERLDTARRTAADADAAEDWEDTVSTASDRDAWINAVAAEGRRAIATGPDAQAWLERMAREAAAELPGDACIVTVPAAQLAGADAWRTRVAADLKKTVRLEAGDVAAGCIARTLDGRVTFDNTVEARERRARTEWRTAVAHVYDEAIATQPAGAA
jgi:hypothetical protein